MPDDLEVIAKIEITIRMTLEKFPPDVIVGIANGFALDDDGQVVGGASWRLFPFFYPVCHQNPPFGFIHENKLDIPNQKVVLKRFIEKVVERKV